MASNKNGKTLNIYELRQNLTEHLSNQQCQNKSRHLNRRYTCEPNISVKNFVPVLRPKSNSEQMIPSKLLLISNRNNNINPLSCPVSEDENEIENDSDSSSSSSDTENNFTKNKKNKLNYIKNDFHCDSYRTYLFKNEANNTYSNNLFKFHNNILKDYTSMQEYFNYNTKPKILL